MIGEERDYIAAVGKNVFGEPLQGFLRSDFYKDARARLVESVQTFHELHGGSNLPGEQI